VLGRHRHTGPRLGYHEVDEGKKRGLIPDLPPLGSVRLESSRGQRHYSQPGKLFRRMNAGQKKALFENTAPHREKEKKH
jgi:catalase